MFVDILTTINNSIDKHNLYKIIKIPNKKEKIVTKTNRLRLIL